jgi:hypothetical protein
MWLIMDKIIPKLLIKLFLQPQFSRELTLSQWQSLLLILRKAQLLARYGLLFQQAEVLDDLPDQVRRHFLNALVLAERQHAQVKYEAEHLVGYLKGKCKFLIFLKGAGYTLSKSPASIGRVFSDIDILVDKASLRQVEQSLAIAGWFPQELDDYDEQYYREWAHEIPPVSHGSRGTVLDIHHNIVPLVSGRSVDVGMLIKNTTALDDGVTVLCPVAMAMHSIIHLFFNEDFTSSFRDMTDLYMMLNDRDDQFWQQLHILSEELGFSTELNMTLRYLQRLFDMKLSDAALQFLGKNPPRYLWLRDFIFDRVLLPDHHLLLIKFGGLASFLAFVRGHWLKMPMHMLFKHFSVKTYRFIAQLVFGEHIFTKKTPDNLTNYREIIKK